MNTLHPLVLTAAFTTAFATQLARQLMRETPPGTRRLLATACASGIAALCSTVLLHEWFAPTQTTLLALSCVVGWSGPRVLSSLGHSLETRLGLRLQDGDEPRPPGS